MSTKITRNKTESLKYKGFTGKIVGRNRPSRLVIAFCKNGTWYSVFSTAEIMLSRMDITLTPKVLYRIVSGSRINRLKFPNMAANKIRNNSMYLPFLKYSGI
jgi:hypothetical protein